MLNRVEKYKLVEFASYFLTKKKKVERLPKIARYRAKMSKLVIFIYVKVSPHEDKFFTYFEILTVYTSSVKT